MTKDTYYNKQIASEASEWVIMLDIGDMTSDDHHNLADWLLISPKHVEEFIKASSLYDMVGAVDQDKNISIESLLEKTAPEVIPLMQMGTAASMALPNSERQTRKRWYAITGSIAACFLMVAIMMQMTPSSAPIVDTTVQLATKFGEQRKITLDDGSIVHVNTLSDVSIEYTDTARIVNLKKGEALFDVAHDPSRPFQVIAGKTITEAIGTSFNIYLERGHASVSVIEGEVALTSTEGTLEAISTNTDEATSTVDTFAGNDGRLLLTAGQRVKVDLAKNSAELREADTKAIASWRVGQLVFESNSLQEIAHQFNRYNHTKILLSDPNMSAVTFSGIFDSNDPESFVQTLELLGEAKADRTTASVIRLYPANLTDENKISSQ